MRVLTSKKIGKSTKNAIYKDGFFFSVGLFLGIGLNDLWRISRSELNYQKLAVAGKDNPFIEEVHMDEIYQYVMVAGADGLAHRRDVRVGLAAGELTQIVSGIEEGELVITNGLTEESVNLPVSIVR